MPRAATCLIEYVVVQKVRITAARPDRLTDVNTKVLIDWEQPLFRECGRHARSFSGAITRDIAEAVSGLQFRTVGSVPAQRC
jgi:hypothetical protein